MNHDGREVIWIQQACLRVGVSRRTIYQWLRDGKIQHTRTAGGRILIYADSLFQTCNGYTPRGTHADPK